MLPQKHRIPREDLVDLQRMRSSGQSPFFILHAGDLAKLPRFSVSVSKKVSKSAVDRNKIRRRVYSELGKQMSEVLPRPYLIRAKTGALNTRGEKLHQEISSLLKPFKRR